MEPKQTLEAVTLQELSDGLDSGRYTPVPNGMKIDLQTPTSMEEVANTIINISKLC